VTTRSLFFFCSDLIEESDIFHKRKRYFRYRTEADYLKLFAESHNEKLAGESTTFYLYSKTAAQEIYTFNPDSKIIIMLRNPVGFVYSSHSHWLVETYEEVEDFRTALSLEEKRRHGRSIPERVYFPSLLYYSETIKYYDMVKRYYDVFDRANIKVVMFEDFKEDNLKVYRDILNFLEVDPGFIPDFKKVNVAKKPRNKYLNYLMQSDFLIKTFRTILSPRLHSLIKQIGQKVLWKEGARPQLNPSLKGELVGKYRPEVLKIGEFLNIDLEKKWLSN
jgi:hypothetical protein